jgi:hypothetical protein
MADSKELTQAEADTKNAERAADKMKDSGKRFPKETSGSRFPFEDAEKSYRAEAKKSSRKVARIKSRSSGR